MKGNNLDAFRVLDKIVKEGSYAKAALALHKTVPSLSYSITNLEKRLDIILLDRSEYRVKTTPLGERLLKEARDVIVRADRLNSLAKQLKSDWEPTLEIVIDGMLTPNIILNVIAQVKAQGSPTIFHLTTEYLGGVGKRFDQANADIMFSLENTYDDRSVMVHLFDIEVLLVAAPSTGLQSNVKYSLADLADLPEISVQDSSYTHAQPGRSLGCSELFFVGDFYIKKQAITNGMGIGWMPKSWIDNELESGALFPINVDGQERDTYPVYVGFSKVRFSGRAQTLFIETLKNQFIQQNK